MKIRFFIFGLLIVILSVQSVFASEINISLDINHEIFEPGDQFIAKLILKNNLAFGYTTIIESIIENEDRSYVNLLPPLSIKLNSNEKKEIELYNFSIDETFNKGDYLLSIRVISHNSTEESTKKFQIIGTLKELPINLKICKDLSCSESEKIFFQNENIYLDYSSEVKNISINANLTYPDKTLKQLTLPTSIRAEQTGTYTLKITASKEGYKTKTLSTQFGVVEKEAEIINTSSCFVNSICEPDLGENYKTCPQDCKPCAKDNICNPDCLTGEDADCKQTTFSYWWLIIGLVIALFLLIILVRHITDRL